MYALRHFVVSFAVVGFVFVFTGCASRHYDPIPGDAVLATEGPGRLAYRAPDDGTVYILEPRRDRVVYRGSIEKDQLVVVDPDSDRIMLDGRAVLEDGLRRGTPHRVYFETDRRAARETVIEERVVRETVPEREVDRERIIIERDGDRNREQRRVVEERRDQIIIEEERR